MKLSIKFIVVTTLIGMSGLVGLRAVFASQQMHFLVAAMPQQASKLLVSKNSDRVDQAHEERQEAIKLRSLAKITQQQAKQAAEAALGGKTTHVELENEDGNLVYEVLIGRTEVIVDAGNGRVLFTENENETEAFHPRSSIQVPKVDDKDDESE